MAKQKHKTHEAFLADMLSDDEIEKLHKSERVSELLGNKKNSSNI